MNWWEILNDYAFLIPVTVAVLKLGLMLDDIRHREADKRDIETLASVGLLLVVAIIIVGVTGA